VTAGGRRPSPALAPPAGPRPAGPPAAPDRVVAAARPRERTLGLYVHIPYCARRCHYCSFATAPLGAEDALAGMLRALHRELALLAALPVNAPPLAVESVFVGGGTPSLLAPEALAGLLDALRAAFRLAADAEVTVECNPESASRAKLEGYRAAGVNRLSLGVQSLDDTILRTLGRLHSARGARAAFDAAREAGFANLSVDVMYGLPGLTLQGWAGTVRAVLDWHPDHLSAYALTLDGGSAWSAGGVQGLPGEDVVVAQYWALAREARSRGLEHYEVSNYARPGARSRHNQIYWHRREYLAIGPSACGFVGDVRYGNAPALARWTAAVDAGRLPVETAERLTEEQALGERLVLGLRTSDGVPAAWLDRRAGGDARLRRRLDAWTEQGLLVLEAGRARLSERGFLLSDALFVELL
jgi:oxygen-independent coproporphyrinogen-3 oxidase